MKISGSIRRFLPKSAFAKSVSILVGGTAAGQAITVLASPLLTRIYTPEEFGTLAVFTSFLSIVAVIASLRYELALPLPEEDETAANVLALSLSIVAANALLIGVLVWLFGDKLVNMVNAPQLHSYLWLLPLGIIGAGFYQVLSFWAVRKKAFNRIAQTKLSQSMGQVSTQVGLGLTVSGPVGLLLGQVIGQAVGSTTLATLAWRNDGQSLKAVNPSEMLRVASRYKRFPLLSSGAAWLNALGLQLPVLLLSGFYGSQTTGWFLLAQRVLGTPLDLLGRSVAQVYFGESAHLAQQHNSKGLIQLFKKLVKYQLLIGLVIVVPVAIAAPWVLPIIFGAQWYEAGLYLTILAPMLLVQFVSSPLGGILDVLERQDIHLIRECLRIGLMTIGVLAATRVGAGPTVAIALLSVAGALSYGGGLFLAWYAVISNRQEGDSYAIQEEPCTGHGREL